MKESKKVFLLFIVCLFSFLVCINNVFSAQVIDGGGGGSTNNGTCSYLPLKKDSSFDKVKCTSNGKVVKYAVSAYECTGNDFLYSRTWENSEGCSGQIPEYPGVFFKYNSGSKSCDAYLLGRVDGNGKILDYSSSNIPDAIFKIEKGVSSQSACDNICNTFQGVNCVYTPPKEEKFDVCVYKNEKAYSPNIIVSPDRETGSCSGMDYSSYVQGDSSSNCNPHFKSYGSQCQLYYTVESYQKGSCDGVCDNIYKTDCKTKSMTQSEYNKKTGFGNACVAALNENGEETSSTDGNGNTSDMGSYNDPGNMEHVNDNGKKITENAEDSIPFCERTDVLKIFRAAGYVVEIIKVVLPAIIIILGVINLSKAVMSSKDDTIKDSVISLAIKFILAAAIFFLPAVITAILKATDRYENVSSNFGNCGICLNSTSECNNVICSVDSANCSTDDTTSKCKGLLGEVSDSSSPAHYVQLAIDVMRYAGIVLCIVMSILDIFKVVSSQDKENISELVSKISKRVIYVVILFFLPGLVNILLSLFGLYGTCGIGV